MIEGLGTRLAHWQRSQIQSITSGLGTRLGIEGCDLHGSDGSMASEGQAHEADAVLPLSGDVQPAAGASTSEQRCPVCLEDFEDKAFVDSCFHILLSCMSDGKFPSSVVTQMLFRDLCQVLD